MKIVFFGTDGVAVKCLAELARDFDVALVVTLPDSLTGRKKELKQTEIAVLGNQLGIEVYKPAKLKTFDVEEHLKKVEADIFVVAVYGKIIPQNILDIPKIAAVNVHPSLLPLYRGPSPIRTPLWNGDTQTGVSIMKMDAQMDHGPIYAQEKLEISPSDTNLTLTEKLADLSAPLLLRVIQGIDKHSVTPVEQNHEAATYTRLVTKEDGRIDWNHTAQEIYNQWRAMQEWPGIFTTWNGKTLKIIECVLTPSPAEERVGERLNDFNTTFVFGNVLEGGIVRCGNNTYLQIQELQLEGKKSVEISAFLNGYKDFTGSILR